MNYALDALWWRLQTSAVRDLATLLTAPPLWDSGCELPVKTLLGEHGFRYLLALDDAPEPLHAYLQPQQPFAGRLGFYAEALLAFWLDNAPHCRLLAHNLPVRDEDGRTLGALDFVAEIGGRAYHLELCCKYYGGTERVSEALCGLNRNDRLADKAAKLQKQLAWPQTEAGRAALQQAGLGGLAVQTASVVRGIAFPGERPSEKTGEAQSGPPLGENAWIGGLLNDWETFAAQHADRRFFVLPRMAYLSPARVPENESCGLAEIEKERDILFAVLERRPDGFLHEVVRWMKR